MLYKNNYLFIKKQVIFTLINIYKIRIIILNFSIIFSFSASAYELGGYEINMYIKEISQASNVAIININIQAYLEKGSGVVLIPLPISSSISSSPNLVQGIDPISSYNNVLFGYIRPDEKYALYLISLLQQPSRINFSLRNIIMATQEINEQGKLLEGKSLQFLFDKAYEAVQNNFPNFNILKLRKITINCPNLYWSDPMFSRNNDKFEINFSEDKENPQPVILYFKLQERTYIFLLALNGLGILIGLFSSPKIITSDKSAIIWAIISVIIIFIIGVCVWKLFPIDTLLADSTAIVSIGTVVGILLGILFSSIWRIAKEIFS